MKLPSISLGALLVLACLAWPQDSGQKDLPAAPSATRQQQNQQADQQQKSAPPPSPPASRVTAIQELKPIGQEAPQEQKPADSKPAPESTPADTTPATPGSDSKPAPPPPSAPSAGDIDNSLTTIVRTVNEVNVVFTVTDKHGRYVKDLKRDAFRVMDDNRPALSIRSFHSETDLPLQVGLLVDASNSVRDRFKFEQEAAIEFLNQIIRPSYDKAFVIGFDTTPELTQDFTDNTELLSKGVHGLRAGGGTAMYDALYFACRDKLLKAPHAGVVRRAIILLSDGDDNQSRVTREEAIEMAQRAEVIVYAISTNVSGVKKQGDKVLERIADATGGKPFFPFQLRDVANAFTEIQDELRSQYSLAYIPDDFQANGRYRTIQILAPNQKQLHVRSRRGYYAPSK
ncbi:MAG TPA: VWA domain-containing protein [Terriglobales bacterium]|jgi:VWFA-related protein